MKNVSAFLKRHSALLLLVLVLATVPAGIAFGKYVKSVNVTNGISITVSVATPASDYTIHKGKLKDVLQDLQTPATALYFVKGSDVPNDAVAVKVGKDIKDIKASGSGSIYAYQKGTDIYIAPADYVDAPLHAPADSSYFLSVNYTDRGGDASKIGLLESIKCDNLDTSRVKNMSYMFYMGKDAATKGSALTTLDVSNFNTANVTNMSNMFCGCDSLTSLNLNFNTTNVTDMSYMFYDCRALTSLDLNFNTSKVTTMSYMFADCIGLTSLNVSSFDTSSVGTMSDMFNACHSLTSLDVSNFNTSNVKYMSNMFCECRSLSSLDLRNFNTSKVTIMSSMFEGCKVLTSLDVSSFDTSSVDNMSDMFKYCRSLTLLDLSNFNTSNVTSMQRMFYTCSKLTTINASDKFNTDKVTASGSMFADCTNLKGGAGTVYSASHVDKKYARIDGGTSNPGYFTGDLTTNSATGYSDAPGINIEG